MGDHPEAEIRAGECWVREVWVRRLREDSLLEVLRGEAQKVGDRSS